PNPSSLFPYTTLFRSEKLEAPLNHILRNGLDHGMEPPQARQAAGKAESGKLTLEARHSAGMLSITVSDDGRGIDTESLRRHVVEDRKSTRLNSSHVSN